MEEQSIDIYDDDPFTTEDLPDEILCIIFSYLPSSESLRAAQRVCQRWYDVMYYDNIWQSCYHRFFGMSFVDPPKWRDAFVERKRLERFSRFVLLW